MSGRLDRCPVCRLRTRRPLENICVACKTKAAQRKSYTLLSIGFAGRTIAAIEEASKGRRSLRRDG